MGSGDYSTTSRSLRSKSLGYDTKPAEEIFQQRELSNGMDPKNIKVREARDSKEHPESFPIILALDVTGSMGEIPHYLVKTGLPQLMQKVIDNGVKHPQLLFIGIGDHTCDDAPLQVGQFESSDELLDKWLTNLFIESGGGGNDGESYLLAWFFASRYTSTDHNEKRGKKGVLITIGDEPTLRELSANAQKAIMGTGEYSDTKAAVLLAKAREKFEVYHLHMLQGSNGTREDVKAGWKQLMGDNVRFVQRSDQVAEIVAELVTKIALGGGQEESPTEMKSKKKNEEEML